MTTAPPQYSPDGRWWWDGTQWLPAQPQGYGYAPYPYAQPQPTDGKAIASLVTGIVWFWGLGSIAAVILGHLSRSEAKNQNRNPSGMALAGLILGYVGIVGAILLVSLVLVGTGKVDSVSNSGSARVVVGGDLGFQLRELAKAEEAYFTDNGSYTQDTTALQDYGWYGGLAFVVNADETSYCLQGTDGGAALFLSSDGDGVTEKPCT